MLTTAAMVDEIEDTVEPPQRPYVLHELLHAYHFGVLPGRFHNPDLLRLTRTPPPHRDSSRHHPCPLSQGERARSAQPFGGFASRSARGKSSKLADPFP